MQAHAWLNISPGVLRRVDTVVGIDDEDGSVAVRFADNPAVPYPIPNAPGSGQELVAVLDLAEELARQYGRSQHVSVSAAPSPHWVITKIEVSRDRLSVWPSASVRGIGQVAEDSIMTPGALPSGGPLPYFTLGLHGSVDQEED